MTVDEILPRITDALTRIRRYDLALKLGLEIGTISKYIIHGLARKIFSCSF